MKTDRKYAFTRPAAIRPFRIRVGFWLIVTSIFAAGCGQLERPKTEPFYAQTPPPPRQEFRWSNGKLPTSIDPARAAAAPETDIVRGVYEGLTDLDAGSLKEIPGVAERWESTADLKTWTFFLRKDARWSNGETVTAEDFVRSWKRLADMRDKAANSYLLRNIVGMERAASAGPKMGEPVDFIGGSTVESILPTPQMSSNTNTAAEPPLNSRTAANSAAPKAPARPEPSAAKFGVEALDAKTLRVSLVSPDKDLPKLVANPIFRPVYGGGATFDKPGLDKSTVTNGAFRMVEIGSDGISLERADHYWNSKAVGLERVRFVPMDSAEQALEAYRSGGIDAITNANFEPLALKLLAPYDDFRRTTHSALNFYEFNLKNAPFSDRRVREALAIAIDRERLAEGELEGSVEPAKTFLPLNENNAAEVAFDVEHAREQLAAAGFPNGEGFPKIRLVINRNNLQQRVARAIARMWKQNLNVETQIIVKEAAEIDAARKTGDFDLVRRGVVLPTADEWISLSAIFDLKRALPGAVTPEPGDEAAPLNNPTQPAPAGKGPMDDESIPESSDPKIAAVSSPARFTEQAAIFEMRAIPLYFPKSYALVKPYVNGFEMNGLDALSLKDVSIDNAWQPKAARGGS